jgi:hypothetical protein
LKRGARIATLRETLSAMPPARPLFFESNAAFSPGRNAEAVQALRESLKLFHPKLLKAKAVARDLSPAALRNPLKELDLESDEFKLVSSSANFLLMAEWASALQSYSPKKFQKFKSVIEALADDLCVCSETLSAALDVASLSWRRDPAKHLVLTHSGVSQAQLASALALLPFHACFPFDAPLHQLWNEMRRHEAGAVVCFDSHCVAELWTVPGLPCFDVKTSFEPSPHDKTLWLPGYKALCLGEELLSAWRNHLPSDVDCLPLEETSLHA